MYNPIFLHHDYYCPPRGAIKKKEYLVAHLHTSGYNINVAKSYSINQNSKEMQNDYL